MVKKKHIFKSNPESLLSVERNTCSKCGFGRKNHRHLRAGIPLQIKWLFGK